MADKRYLPCYSLDATSRAAEGWMSMAIDCYECTAYGDDYYLDDNGEWVSACEGCPNNEAIESEDK